MLTCTHCAKPCGARVESVLQLSSCGEDQTVTNVAGILKCKELRPENAADVPEGTYLTSCYRCQLNGGILACTCLNGAGDAFETSLPLGGCQPGTAVNEEGNLVCSTANSDDAPSGTYLTSCIGCQLGNGALTCTCLDAAGNKVKSMIALAGCEPDSIENVQGSLTCTRASAQWAESSAMGESDPSLQQLDEVAASTDGKASDASTATPDRDEL